MSVEIQTSEGPLIIPDQQFQAVAHHAERMAELTAATLDATGHFPNRPTVLPAGFLLELGAVLELGLWERQGLTPYLSLALPTFAEAATALAARAKQGPGAFDNPEAALLPLLVVRAWMEHFAWEGYDFLQADIVLGVVDEDHFAQLLSDFLWQHRHELSRLLNKQR